MRRPSVSELLILSTIIYFGASSIRTGSDTVILRGLSYLSFAIERMYWLELRRTKLSKSYANVRNAIQSSRAYAFLAGHSYAEWLNDDRSVIMFTQLQNK